MASGPATAVQLDEAPEPFVAPRRAAGPVLIAGGGIGGLAAALALARTGLAAHVLERRPAFSEEGAGIQIGPNGTRILASLGVASSLEPDAAAPDGIQVHDGTLGRALVRLPLGSWIRSRHGAPYWVAHRQDLHGALLKRARAEPLIRVSTGAEIASVETETHAVTARTLDGRSWTGAVLVAADGLWSRLRAAHFEGTAPRFTGRSAFRAVIAANAVPSQLSSRDVHLWLAPGAHVVHYPVRAGADVAIVAIFDEPRAITGWSAPVEPGLVRRLAAGFPAQLRQLLEQPDSWRKWSLHTLPGQRRLARGRVALLGDAAHPVLPFLAQGGVLALEDAVVLADCLARVSNDVAQALASYERQRRGRAARVARASRLNGSLYHLTGVAAMARNRLLGAIAPERLMARYDWLYGWTPPSP